MKPRADRPRKRQAKYKTAKLRIVSGRFKGKKIVYNGDPATRPMKERTRESVFSLLGGKLGGRMAIDLFGGTGILAFESLSRGADQAIVCELARPAMSMILDNMRALELSDQLTVHNVDSLRWMRDIAIHASEWPDMPWAVFCCPPYRLWESASEKMAQGLVALIERAPAASCIVCETEQRFRIEDLLPQFEWDTRKYSPAKISVHRKLASPTQPA